MYTFHELSYMFPPMTAEQFTALVEDIKTNGQTEPIVLLDNQVLDGRNRYRAIEQLGKLSEIKTRIYSEPVDPRVWVKSTNLRRRFMTTAQRAAGAALEWNQEAALAQGRRGKRADLIGDADKVPTVRQLAAEWTVDDKNISLAKKMQDKDPGYFQAMFTGEVTMVEARAYWETLDSEAKSKAEAKAKAEAAAESARIKAIQDTAIADQKAAADAERKANEAEQKKLRAEIDAQRKAAEKAEADKQRAVEAERQSALKEAEKVAKAEAKARAEFEAKVREDAANNGVNLSDLSPENKAKLMTIIANDPEKADSFFEAQKESQRRRNEKATQDAAEKTRKLAEAAEKKASREAAEAARQDYEASALYHLLKNIIPAAHEGNALLSNKGLTLDHVLVSGHSPDELVKFTESLEDIADNFRQVILKVVDEIKQ